MISITSDVGFNVAIFTNDPNSTLFNTFQFPGTAISDEVEIPANAFIFFGRLKITKLLGI